MSRRRPRNPGRRNFNPHDNLAPGESLLKKHGLLVPRPPGPRRPHWPAGTPQAKIDAVEACDRILEQDPLGLRKLGYSDHKMGLIYFAPPDVRQAMLEELGIAPKTQQSSSQGGQQGTGGGSSSAGGGTGQGQGQSRSGGGQGFQQQLQALQLQGAGGAGISGQRQAQRAQLLAALAAVQQSAGQGLNQGGGAGGQGLQQLLQRPQLQGVGGIGFLPRPPGTTQNILAALAGLGKGGGRPSGT